MTTNSKLMTVLIVLSLSGCCSVTNDNYAVRPSIVTWDGSGVYPFAPKRRPHRVASTHARGRDEAQKRSANAVFVDVSDEEMGERATSEKLNRALVICRGC